MQPPCPEASSCDEGLHTLPADVLLIILSKLAAQDPPSFGASTRACKIFMTVASDEELCLWKKILFGSDYLPKDTSEMQAFDQAVAKFGGYKSLVKARWRKPCFTSHSQLSSSEEKKTDEEGNPCQQNQCLFLFRTLQGRLVMWGFCEDHIKGLDDLHLNLQQEVLKRGFTLFDMGVFLHFISQDRDWEEALLKTWRQVNNVTNKDARQKVLVLEMFSLPPDESAPLYMRFPESVYFSKVENRYFDAKERLWLGGKGTMLWASAGSEIWKEEMSISFSITARLEKD